MWRQPRRTSLNALVFLCDKVLQQPLGDIGAAVRAKRPPRLPVVLTHEEAMAIIAALGMPYRLLAALMYDAGLRVVESVRLRVKDIDFSRRVITVRNGKGGKDRTTLLPESLDETLRKQLAVSHAKIDKPAGCHTFRTRSRPNCCAVAATSAPFRNCSVTRICEPRKSTRTCWGRDSPAFAARWAESSSRRYQPGGRPICPPTGLL
jgi:integrase